MRVVFGQRTIPAIRFAGSDIAQPAHSSWPMKAFPRALLACSLFFCLATIHHSVAAPPASGMFTYRRIFKSSTPEFIEIKIDENSDKASYEIRQLDEDPGSTPFEIGPALRKKIFELIAHLNYFQGVDLD